ncbi:MAG: DNA mismatch repair protein MutS [Planctomycetota bacterium]
MTPLMEQYQAIKNKYSEEILFFRLGDFYEMFYEDAKTASKVLGITLTSRFKDEKTVPMAGVPYHSATIYINRLLRAGYKVAVCEQTEPAESAEGLVDRSVVRVITPGTIVEDNLLDSKTPNFLCAVSIEHSKYDNTKYLNTKILDTSYEGNIGISWIDLSTGEFKTQEFPFNLNRLVDELRRINPSECLIPEYVTDHKPDIVSTIKTNINVIFTSVNDWTFEYNSAYKTLIDHFHTTNLAGFGCEGTKSGISAAGAILQYLYETQTPHARSIEQKTKSQEDSKPPTTGVTLSSTLKYITKLELYSSDNRLYLDRATQISLELLSTMSYHHENRKDNISYGSLLWVIDKTQTAMGARLIRDWLLSPLTDISIIKYRQDGVATFVNDIIRRKELQKELKECADIERITAKIGSGRANARDMVAIKKTLQLIPVIKTNLTQQPERSAPPKADPRLTVGQVPLAQGCKKETASEIFNDICVKLDPLEALQKLIATALVDGPPLDLSEGGFIKEGYNNELDRLRNLCSEGMDFIARFQSEEIKRTGINSLKVGYNQIFGYYIEVTNVHTSKIPPNYIRKQTLKNAERYITPELKDYETQVLHAKERSHELEYEIFCQVRKEAENYIVALQNIASAIATLDCILSFAQVAQENNYCAPLVNDSLTIRIIDGRHPVLERVLEEKFIPNDIYLGSVKDCHAASGEPPAKGEEGQRIIILTGPNMAGKSTYIRQIALIVLMAQMGSFVPAKEATIGIVDRIFTRIGAFDELTRGSSTFMVEMNETANILNNATKRSLIILDEVGRGTSTFDGVSIAWAVTEYIHDNLGSRTLFATHYHELTELALILPAVKNYCIAVKEWGDKVIFTRKIVAGGTDKSYGIHVARLAGLPEEAIKRARQILAQFEKQAFDAQGKPLLDGGIHKLKTPDLNQLPLFNTLPHPVSEALKGVDINNLTPIQALEKLSEIKKLLSETVENP